MRRYRDRSRHDLIPPRRTGHADFPHPALASALTSGMRRQLCGPGRQVHQAHTLEVLEVAHPFRRSKGPLAAAARVLAQPPTYEGIDLSKGHARVSEAEVVRPAGELPIDLCDHCRQWLETLLLADRLSQCLSPARHRFLRGVQVQISMLASVEVAIIPKREPQKLQACSLLPQIDYPRFLPIDLQTHPGFQLLLDVGAQLRALMACQHHEIIGVAHQLCLRPVRRSFRRVEHLVEIMQVEVCQQRGDHPALWRAACRPRDLLRPTWGGGWLDHFDFQPTADQAQDGSVCDPHAQTGHQLVVWDRVEVSLQVRVIHRLIPGLEMTAYLPQRLVGGAPRAKPVRAVQEVHLKDGLQNQQGCGLHDPIAQSRDAQGSQLSICLGDVDAPYGSWSVGLGAQLLVELLDQLHRTVLGGLDHLDRHTIDSGTAAVGLHLQPRRPQHIAPIDPVVQRIEPELRLLLGLVAQLLSQSGEALRQFGSLPRTRVPELLLCQVFRSGTLVQAAHPSSDSSAHWLRPLRSAVVTRFLATMGRSDSRPQPRARLCLSVRRRAFCSSCCAGSPRFLGRSVPARCPLSSRQVRRSLLPVASPPVAGFSSSGETGHPQLRITRPNRVRLSLRLTGSPPEASPTALLRRTLGWLSVERAINRVTSFQVTRTARLCLAHRITRMNEGGLPGL